MAVPKWGFVAFLILLSLSICSGHRLHQSFLSIPSTVDTNKADEVDHHDNLNAQTSGNNIEVKGFGVGGGAGYGIGGGWGVGGGGGSNAPNYGCGINGCGTPGFTIPGFGGLPGCPPGCGYACPANSPTGGILTEVHISGLSRQFKGPYRCRADILDSEDINEHELVLHFVTPGQHKNENQNDHHTVERNEEDGADHHSEQHKVEDIIN